MTAWAITMRKGTDECVTICDAGTANRACQITEASWRQGWRAIAATRMEEFYVVLDARSEEEEAALTELRKTNLQNANYKPLQTPLGIFPSLKEAAAATGITPAALRYRIQTYPEDYIYINDKIDEDEDLEE